MSPTMMAFHRERGLGGCPSGRPSVRHGRGGCGGVGGDGREDEDGAVGEVERSGGVAPRGGGEFAFESWAGIVIGL